MNPTQQHIPPPDWWIQRQKEIYHFLTGVWPSMGTQ